VGSSLVEKAKDALSHGHIMIETREARSAALA
jgi:hypothetical protein